MANPFERFKSSYRTGDYVFRDTDLGTEMFIIQSGRIDLVKQVMHREEVIAELEKGDFFGEMAVLESLPRNMSARVVEDAELIAINSSTFDKMIKSNIEIAVRMLRKFSGRIREADAENVRLMHRNRELEEGRADEPMLIAQQEPAAHPETAAIDSPFVSPGAAAVVAPAAPVQPPEPVVSVTPVIAAIEVPVAALVEPTPPVVVATPVVTEAKPAPVAEVSSEPPPKPPPLRRTASVVVKGTERKYTLSSHDVTIGRADPVTGLRPDIDLSTEDVNRFISRRHAKIVYKDGTHYLVEEVGVTNGTYLNGKRLQSGVYSPIRHGDELCFGKVFVTFLEGA